VFYIKRTLLPILKRYLETKIIKKEKFKIS